MTSKVKGRKITVISMISDNVQYWLTDPMKVPLPLSEMIVVKGG